MNGLVMGFGIDVRGQDKKPEDIDNGMKGGIMNAILEEHGG